jgi:hypothetical protein
MDEEQFRRMLELFPVVRASSYCADDVNGVNRRAPTGLIPLQASSTVQLHQVDTGSTCHDSDTGKAIQSPTETGKACQSLTDTGKAIQSPTDTGKAIQSSPPPPVAASSGQKGVGNFWDMLKESAEKQLGPEKGQQFCEAFRARHNELVNKTLSLDAIERIAKHWPLPAK